MDESGGLTRGSFPGSFPAAAAPCRSAAGLGGLVESRPELRTELSRPRAGVHRIPWQQAIIRSQWLSHRKLRMLGSRPRFLADGVLKSIAVPDFVTNRGADCTGLYRTTSAASSRRVFGGVVS